MTTTEAIAVLGGPEAARDRIDKLARSSSEWIAGVCALALAGLEAQQAPSDAEVEAWERSARAEWTDRGDGSQCFHLLSREIDAAVALMRRGRQRDELRALREAAEACLHNYDACPRDYGEQEQDSFELLRDALKETK